jgi:heme oxygenase
MMILHCKIVCKLNCFTKLTGCNKLESPLTHDYLNNWEKNIAHLNA